MSIREENGQWVARVEVRRTFRTKREAMSFQATVRAHQLVAVGRFDHGQETPSLQTHGEQWLSDLQANGVSEHRIEFNRRTLARIAEELPEQLDAPRRSRSLTLGEVSKDALKAWRHRRLKKGICASTINNEVAVLVAFGNWAMEEELWSPDGRGIRWLKLKRLAHNPRQPEAKSPQEFVNMNARLPQQINLPWLCQYRCGDRPGAIYAANWDDVHWPDPDRRRMFGWLALRLRKGGPQMAEDVPFHIGDALHQILLAARELFFRTRGRYPRGTDPIFMSSRAKGQRWDGPTFNSALKYHCKRAKLKPVSPYLARHSVGTNLIRAGANSYQAQAALGHRDGRTTQNYVHLCGADRLQAMLLVDGQLAPHLEGMDLMSAATPQPPEN